jgi:hypothetical protein
MSEPLPEELVDHLIAEGKRVLPRIGDLCFLVDEHDYERFFGRFVLITAVNSSFHVSCIDETGRLRKELLWLSADLVVISREDVRQTLFPDGTLGGR